MKFCFYMTFGIGEFIMYIIGHIYIIKKIIIMNLELLINIHYVGNT